MIRDITIGQYYPSRSVIHRLDPRTKLAGTLIFIISVFLFHTVPGYAVATVFLAGVIISSTVPVKFIFKGLKAIFMILLITMVDCGKIPPVDLFDPVTDIAGMFHAAQIVYQAGIFLLFAKQSLFDRCDRTK